MKIGVLGAWHVHTEDYVRATREEGSHELKLLWDHDAKRGRRQRKDSSWNLSKI